MRAYLLGLRARRLAILTGISGTGKMALALALAKYFAGRLGPIPPEPSGRFVTITVQPSQTRYKRFFVPRAVAAWMWPPGQPAPKTARVAFPTGEVDAALYADEKRGSLHVALSGALFEWYRALDKGAKVAVLPGNEVPVATLRLEPFVESPVEPGRSRHLVLEVRPDWTDSHALLGFFNPVLGAYQRTPLLDLLLEAADDYRRLGDKAPPNFVILDEMNLARVEHYFAELLSCLESDQPLKLHSMDGEEDEELDVPARLVVPPNVFFTGTVNVDETTHMFSPKVLDRAFVFEFNDVDLKAYGQAKPATPAALPLSLDFTGWRKPTPEDWRGFIGDGVASATVLRLHEALEKHGRHFGYRRSCASGGKRCLGKVLPKTSGALGVRLLTMRWLRHSGRRTTTQTA